jgi:hypothetical protein
VPDDIDMKQVAESAYHGGKRIADCVVDVTGKLYTQLIASAKTPGGEAVAKNAMIYAGSFCAAKMTFLTISKEGADSQVVADLEAELQRRVHMTITDFCEKITTKCVTISFEVPKESL